MNDEKLIELLKQNPSQGISCSIEKYGALVKTIVMRILGYENERDIEECISDIFVEVWKSIDNYDASKGLFKNYIISIARYVSINTYRRKLNKQVLIPLEENDLEMDFDLGNEVERNINKNIINETINSLPQPDKDIFIRRYYLFESIKDISIFLNLNTKLIENKLYRGKEKLKAALISKGINL